MIRMQKVLYLVETEYRYNDEGLPNISMLTSRNLKARIETALEMSRKDGNLGTSEVTAMWIKVT